jgi:hypothetical protein
MKLTEAMKKEILERVEAGENYTYIAKDFGVVKSTVSYLALNNGIRKRSSKNSDGKVCPKCHRVGLKSEFVFCPYCAADIRTEREIVAGLLDRAIASMKAPLSEAESKICFAMRKALDFVNKHEE